MSLSTQWCEGGHFHIVPHPIEWVRRTHPDAEVEHDENHIIFSWYNGSMVVTPTLEDVVLTEDEHVTVLDVNTVTSTTFDEFGDSHEGDVERIASVVTHCEDDQHQQEVVFSDGTTVLCSYGGGTMMRTILDDEGVHSFGQTLYSDGWEVSPTAVSRGGTRLASKWGNGWTRHVDLREWLDAMASMRSAFPDAHFDEEGVPVCPR